MITYLLFDLFCSFINSISQENTVLLGVLQSLWSYPASLHDTQNAVTQKEACIESNQQAIRNKLAIGSLAAEGKNKLPNKTTTKPHHFIHIQAFRGSACTDLYFFFYSVDTFPLKMQCCRNQTLKMHHFHSTRKLLEHLMFFITHVQRSIHSDLNVYSVEVL